MTNEERDIITRFIERVAGTGGGGSVPATAASLPPVDPEADALIGELFARNPEARYRLAQTAFVQEHALAAAQQRIAALEAELTARPAAPAPAPRGGFFSGLFGGGAALPPPPQQAPQMAPQQAYAPPPPYNAPGYQPGMFQRGGSGFLGSALATAAGVAGGVVAGNALMNLFSPHAGFGGGAFGGGAFGGGAFGGTPENVTVINENASPWANPGAGADPGQGGVDPNQAGFDPSQDGFDPGQQGFDPTQAGFDPSQAGLDPNAGFDSGNFDSGNFGGDDLTQV